MKIKVLSEETINKIAAGEVVERPASVVKELVENSIDSGATEVKVEVKASGKSLIRVTDNGAGMDKDDAVLCFQRHATSKINRDSDIYSIGTLGFRGEALPSIASVGKIELITKPEGSVSAYKIRVEGGKLLEAKETGSPKGTVISVSNLFYNTPARKKFLKTNNTELSHIINTMYNYALAYDKIGFSLIHNGEIIFEVFSKDTLLDRIKLLCGKDVAEGVVGLDFERSGIKVCGYAGMPVITRPNRSSQFIFVNKRPVTDRSISYGIFDAYSTLIPKGRFPVMFLFLEIPPDSLDVNIHPAKKEVRFGNSRLVQDVVKEAILGVLGVKADSSSVSMHSGTPSVSFSGPSSGQKYSYAPEYKTPDTWIVQETMAEFEKGENYKAFQVLDSYLIVETGNGIIILDQHAMQERILYEKIKNAFNKKSPVSQRLLLPVNVELTPAEQKLISANISFFKELGFNVEDFGGSTIIIDMIPAVLLKVDINGFIKDTLSEIKELGKSVSEEKIKESVIKMMACKAAVKQGDKLDILEVRNLVKEWYNSGKPVTCPHGRPCIIEMGVEELNKKFHRT